MKKKEKLRKKIYDLAYLTEEIFGLVNVIAFVMRHKKASSVDLTATVNILVEKIMVFKLESVELKDLIK